VKPHLATQQALVRMLFDPAFAAAVRRDPGSALPELPSTLRAQLAAIDPRALKLDRLLGRRVLRTLFDEFKASTTLLLARKKRLAYLDRFFAANEFVDVLAQRPLHDAYAAFLIAADHSLSGVVAIENGLAWSRRRRAPRPDGRVHRAPGVSPIPTTKGALVALQQTEQYLFEVGLMPAVALCEDAPPLVLDEQAADETRLDLVAVHTETGHSLVTVDQATLELLLSLPRAYARELQPLIDDEIAVQT